MKTIYSTYKGRKIGTDYNGLYWSFCVDDDGNRIGQVVFDGKTKIEVVNKLKKHIDNVIHYNGY